MDKDGYRVQGTATFMEDGRAEADTALSIPVGGGNDMVYAQQLEVTVVGRFDQPFPVSATITSHFTRQSASMRLDISGIGDRGC